MTELTILMPCLNEAETLGRCIAQGARLPRARGHRGRGAGRRQRQHRRLAGARASAAGARVVPSPRARLRRGAAAAGIAAARGRYVIMGDADDSYDFSRLDAFVEQLRGGDDLVMGNRFQGGIRPGRDAAAAPLPRQPGAVASSAGCSSAARVGDFHCGLRGFDREARPRARPAHDGHGVRERDGGQGDARRAGASPRCRPRCARTAAAARRTCAAGATAGATCASCCCSARAGCSSTPGSPCSCSASALMSALYFAPLRVLGAGLDIHSMLYASAAALLGLQLCLFALFARVSAQNAGLLPRQPALERLLQALTLERGLLARPGDRPDRLRVERGGVLAVARGGLRRARSARRDARHDPGDRADGRRHGARCSPRSCSACCA